MDFTIHSLKVTILIRIFSICLFPSIRIISKRIFSVFLNFIWFVSRRSKNEKNLHELWTAPNLIVACLEFLWIDLMLDYVLQWKGIWYYRYDMACSLQFTEAGSLMGIGLHYYCDCPRIPYDVLSLVLLYRSAFVEECMCQSLQIDQGNLMIIQCIYFYWDSVSALIRSSTLAYNKCMSV